MKTIKHVALAATISTLLGGIATTVNAANWLMLQGTEKPGAAPRAKVWGFVQPGYLESGDTKLPVGNFSGQDSQFNTHQPNLSSNKTFQIMRARLGVRGLAMPLDSNVNYFLLAEYGNNGITTPGGGAGAVKLTDATVTLNHIKGMRIRVGQMKIPMSEEIYQGIMGFNYINMTNLANQQLIERPFWTDGNQPCMLSGRGGTGADANTSNAQYLKFCNVKMPDMFRANAVAVRDTGIQLFDTFKSGAWEHSYAVLVGNGGISQDNRENQFDTTVYLSSEKVYSGKGPFRDHLKLYAWATRGKRSIYDSALLHTGSTPDASKKMYDRNLTGLGLTYQKNKFRFWAEYIVADGMIFTGSTGGAVPGAISNDGAEVAQFLLSPKGKADGGYIDFGYKIIPKLELLARYDWYNRVTNLGAKAERRYDTTTLGLQYRFNKKAKFLFNYEFRTLKAPKLASTSPANKIGASMTNKLSAQLYVLF